MDRLLLPFAAFVIVFAVYRAVSTRCLANPRLRPPLIIAAIAGLSLAALLVPWLLADLNPPWSESPAGIFVYLGKAAIVGGLGLAALGTFIGAVIPARPPVDPAA